ncbi:hypothetical protein ACJX0J_006902, partial [Zea mays]
RFILCSSWLAPFKQAPNLVRAKESLIQVKKAPALLHYTIKLLKPVSIARVNNRVPLRHSIDHWHGAVEHNMEYDDAQEVEPNHGYLQSFSPDYLMQVHVNFGRTHEGVVGREEVPSL